MPDGPHPLAYSTPPSAEGRPAWTRIDWVTGSLAALQLTGGIFALTFAVHDAKYDTGGPSAGYMWVASVVCGPVVVSLANVLSTAVAMTGAGSVDAKRRRKYGAYLIGWPAFLAVAMLATAVVIPWPGDRTHRWIAVHNLSAMTAPFGEVTAFVRVAAIASPACWAIAVPTAYGRAKRLLSATH